MGWWWLGERCLVDLCSGGTKTRSTCEGPWLLISFTVEPLDGGDSVVKWSLSQRLLRHRIRWPALVPSMLLAYLALKARWPWLPGWSCPIRHLTGIPCPGCFLARSIALSLSGRLGSALEWHVLGPPAAAALAIWSINALRRGQLTWTHRNRQFLVVFTGIAVVVWGTRLLMQYGFGVQAFPAN